MIHEVTEPVRGQRGTFIILGEASWGGEKSVKYGWPNKLGHMSRGGEVPIHALPQMFEMAIREGYLKVARQR